MSANGKSVAYVALAVLLASAVASAMSIEAEPVKVTHHNSGPRYDIDTVERTKLLAASANQELPQAPREPADRPPVAAAEGGSESGDDAATPIGHVAIRRIFLFPIRPSELPDGPRDMQAQPAGENQREQENEREPMPSMFAKPFWPFMTPARPMSHQPDAPEHPHRPHLFGADEASRPPPSDRDQDKQASSVERETAINSQRQQPQFDPIQMMMDLMHQAITSQLAPNFTSDLSKDAPASGGNDNAPAESSDERPQMPATGLAALQPALGPAKNETREDVVEIEGKKYLRKTVTNRHVGENIIFVTRRLIFVPLNDTDSTTTDTVATTTTDLPTTSTASEPEAPVAVDRVGDNKPVPSTEAPTATTEQTTTTSSTTTTSQPITSSSTVESEPSVEATTPKLVEPAAAEVSGKAAERLVEEAPSKPATPEPINGETPKPAESSA